MKSFCVILERQGKFIPYDIMPHLINAYNKFCSKANELQCNEEGYWKIPITKEEFKAWIMQELRYQFWSRCEYEIILSSWPNNTNHKKIDVYWQCEMNMDLIVDIFIENISK